MNAWGEEDPPPDEVRPAPRRGVHGRHLVLVGLVLVVLGAAPAAFGAPALGAMLMVLGATLAVFGSFGWWMEHLGAWDDDPGGPDSIKLLDVARLATRIRRH